MLLQEAESPPHGDGASPYLRCFQRIFIRVGGRPPGEKFQEGSENLRRAEHLTPQALDCGVAVLVDCGFRSTAMYSLLALDPRPFKSQRVPLQRDESDYVRFRAMPTRPKPIELLKPIQTLYPQCLIAPSHMPTCPHSTYHMLHTTSYYTSFLEMNNEKISLTPKLQGQSVLCSHAIVKSARACIVHYSHFTQRNGSAVIGALSDGRP